MKKILFFLTFTLSLILLASCAGSGKSTAKGAFEALSKGDAKLFYSYLDINEGDFITPEHFEEAFSNYEIPSEYTVSKKSDLLWTASYDGGSRIIMLTEDKRKIDSFPFIDDDVTIHVPKGSRITVDGIEFSTPSSTENSGYDEYKIGRAFLYSVLPVLITGDTIEDKEINVVIENYPLNLTDADLKEGVEREIINSAATFVMGLYYGAERGESSLPLESYLFSGITVEERNSINQLYTKIKKGFAVFDGMGELREYGIYDLHFSDFFGNVTKKESGLYTANVTLSYSYLPLTPDGNGEEVFSDMTVSVGMTYDGGKWSVVNLENAIIE